MRYIAVAISLGVLAIAGCGGGGGDASTSPPTPETGSVSATASATPATLLEGDTLIASGTGTASSGATVTSVVISAGGQQATGNGTTLKVVPNASGEVSVTVNGTKSKGTAISATATAPYSFTLLTATFNGIPTTGIVGTALNIPVQCPVGTDSVKYTASGQTQARAAASATFAYTPSVAGSLAGSASCKNNAVERTTQAPVVTIGPRPVITLSVSPTSPNPLEGDSVVIVWSSRDATSCDSYGAWTGSRALSGTAKAKLVTYGQATFGLRCAGAGVVADSAAVVTARVRVRTLSYDNFKSIGLVPSSLPHNDVARAYGDFFGEGQLSLFTAMQTYNPAKPQAVATVSIFQFWSKNASGGWVERAMPVTAQAPTCLHPRKAVVADFNEDSRPDIFVACHGYDAVPFPGERNVILLSQADGGYVLRAVDAAPAFFHGSSACDINGDAHADVIIVDGLGLRVFLGDGKGNFTYPTNHPLASVRGSYYSVECLDVDEDGVLDVVAGGHEPSSTVPTFGSAPTTVLRGTGSGSYAASVVPSVEGQGVVVDFTVSGTGATRTLWISRSSGGDGTFYQGRVVQRISWQTLAGEIAFKQQPGGWLPWLVTFVRSGALYIGSDNKNDNFELVIP